MFLNSTKIIGMKKPFDGPLALTEIEVSKSYHATPIVELYYHIPFTINKFRWVWLSTILMNEEVTFEMGENLCKGRITKCKSLDDDLLLPEGVFDSYDNYAGQNILLSEPHLYLEIQVIEVIFNG